MYEMYAELKIVTVGKVRLYNFNSQSSPASSQSMAPNGI